MTVCQSISGLKFNPVFLSLDKFNECNYKKACTQ